MNMDKDFFDFLERFKTNTQIEGDSLRAYDVITSLRAQLAEKDKTIKMLTESLRVKAAYLDEEDGTDRILELEQHLAEKEKELRKVHMQAQASEFSLGVVSQEVAALRDQARAYVALCAADDGQGGVDSDFTYIDKKELFSLKSQLEAIRKQTVELNRRADNAYIKYIDKMSKDLCLGYEQKLKDGSFTGENLRAHCNASEYLGIHCGLSEAIRALSLPTTAEEESK